jgi:hypothetical protein
MEFCNVDQTTAKSLYLQSNRNELDAVNKYLNGDTTTTTDAAAAAAASDRTY